MYAREMCVNSDAKIVKKTLWNKKNRLNGGFFTSLCLAIGCTLDGCAYICYLWVRFEKTVVRQACAFGVL